jgi:hypothetical protein
MVDRIRSRTIGTSGPVEEISVFLVAIALDAHAHKPAEQSEGLSPQTALFDRGTSEACPSTDLGDTANPFSVPIGDSPEEREKRG